MNAKNIARGIVLAVLFAAGAANAQTTTTGASSTTPGVGNTGAGGLAAQNMLLLGSSAVIALAGTAYLARRRVS